MVALLIAAGVTAALGFILAIVSLVLVIVAPSFDEFGQINECIGCPMNIRATELPDLEGEDQVRTVLDKP